MDVINRLLNRQTVALETENETDGTTDWSAVDVATVLDPNFNKSEIRKKKLNLKKVGEEKKFAFLLKNVFTPKECNDLIKITEAKGYIAALLNIGGGREMYVPSARNSLRCIIDNKEFVRILMERIDKFIPETFKGKERVEINERLRFLRYDPGNKFKMHCDGAYVRPDCSAQSMITLQVYLNEGFEGGETTFFNNNLEAERTSLPVVPKTGMVLVFQHDMLHEGSILKVGRKYTVRTEVMYTFHVKK